MLVTVDVTLTDRTRLPDGGYRTFTARVTVEALSETDGRLAAIQMATAIRCDLDAMPLGDRVVEIAI